MTLRPRWLLIGILVLAVGAVTTRWGLLEYRAWQRTHLPGPTFAARERGTGSATLRWAPLPREARSDDTNPDPVVGFRIYLGRTPETLGLAAVVPRASASSHKIKDLAKGRHYYAITTYTRLGIESERSEIVSKDVP